LLLAMREPFPLSDSLTESAWAIPLHVATGLAAVAAITALAAHRYHLARVAAAAQTSLILWGWVAAQYPRLVPTAITIGSAAAPASTLRAVTWALGAGAVVLVPSLVYLYRVFKGSEPPAHSIPPFTSAAGNG